MITLAVFLGLDELKTCVKNILFSDSIWQVLPLLCFNVFMSGCAVICLCYKATKTLFLQFNTGVEM